MLSQGKSCRLLAKSWHIMRFCSRQVRVAHEKIDRGQVDVIMRGKEATEVSGEKVAISSSDCGFVPGAGYRRRLWRGRRGGGSKRGEVWLGDGAVRIPWNHCQYRGKTTD